MISSQCSWAQRNLTVWRNQKVTFKLFDWLSPWHPQRWYQEPAAGLSPTDMWALLQEIPARFLLPKETFGSPEALWELTGKALILVFIFKHNFQYPQPSLSFHYNTNQPSSHFSLERRDHVYSFLLLAAQCRSKAALPLTNLESSTE